jgi:hypothetical protein
VFNPNTDRESLLKQWPSQEEVLNWEVPFEGGRLTCHNKNTAADKENLVLYPDLIYRRYENETLVDESVLSLIMNCYYPDEFIEVVEHHGFHITNKWGGYEGQTYGEGPELVIEFEST